MKSVSERKILHCFLVLFILLTRGTTSDVKHRAIVTQSHFRRYRQYHVSAWDPVHHPEKHHPEWTQSRMGTFPNLHIPEWTQALMDTIPNGTIPNGHNPEWTQSRMDTIPNEYLQLYSYFGVL